MQLDDNVSQFKGRSIHHQARGGVKRKEKLQSIHIACACTSLDLKGMLSRDRDRCSGICTCYLCPDVWQSPLARGQLQTQDAAVPCCLAHPHTSTTPQPLWGISVLTSHRSRPQVWERLIREDEVIDTVGYYKMKGYVKHLTQAVPAAYNQHSCNQSSALSF